METLEAGDLRAAIPVDLIGKLYAIERAATEAGEDHAARLARRQREASPILDALGKWIADTCNAEPPKSALAKACHYAINRWQALRRFLEDGRLPLDNTASERAPPGRGRQGQLPLRWLRPGRRARRHRLHGDLHRHAGRGGPPRVPHRRLQEDRRRLAEPPPRHSEESVTRLYAHMLPERLAKARNVVSISLPTRTRIGTH